MSLHRHISSIEHRDGTTYWRSTCDCGWWGGEHPVVGTSLVAADFASAEYREHVENELGADAYYPAAVGCTNCGSQHSQPVLIGTHVSSGRCARCGMGTLLPDNEVWHDSRSSRQEFDG
jgi:hypothetical protein